MPASSLGRRRPRPVADAPLVDGALLAKAWLVELVAVAPLELAARLPGPRFAEDAPRLCAAIVAALASDAAFDDLEPGGSLAPLAAGAGFLAAAPGPLDAMTALEALRAVAWAEVQRALDRPEPVQVAQLADRLAAVVAAVAAAVLDAPGPPGPPRPRDRGPLAAVLRGDAAAATAAEAAPSVAAAPPAAAASPRGEATPSVAEAAPSAEGAPPAAAASPRGEAAPSVAEAAPSVAAAPPAAAASPRGQGAPAAAAAPSTGRLHASEPPREEDVEEEAPPPPPPTPLRPPGEPAPPLDPAAHLRSLEAALRHVAASDDPLARLRELAREAAPAEPEADPFSAAAARLRGSAGPAVEDAAEFHAARIAPWTAAIDRRLARHRQDGLPFAVLCVELVDVDRLAAADFDGEVARALEAAEGAVCAQLRPADVLVRERPGRYWLTAPDTDGAEARTLAHRVAGAIAGAAAHRDVPLQAAIGLATCPADGADAVILEGRAEEGVFAARAAGVRVG